MARSGTSGVMAGVVLLLGTVGAAGSTAHAERLVVFTDDLEEGTVRSEWTGGRIEHTPAFTRYLGRMTDQPLGLRVDAPEPIASRGGKVTYYMRFDLFTLDGWTGRIEGKDTRFEVSVGDRVMFSHSLASEAGGGTFREPTEGPDAMAYGGAADCVYRGVLVSFELGAEEALDVRFRALGLAPQKDFSALSQALGGGEHSLQKDVPAWGIDNVEIWCETADMEGGSAGREAEPPLLMGALADLAGGGGNPFSTEGASGGARPPISAYEPPGPRELMPMEFGSGNDDPPEIVIPPVTPENRPSDPTTQEDPPKDDPIDDPVDNPEPEHRETPPESVPAPGVLGLFSTGALVIARRRRRVD